LPLRGSVRVLGSSIPGRTAREAQQTWRDTGTVQQDAALFETRSALGNVELALRVAGLSRKQARQEATEWLRRVGLGDKLHEPPRRLSGGQQQRVALARALSTRPKLLILDEPTSHLDYALAREVLSLARDLVEQGTSLIMATHRIQEAEEIANAHVALPTQALVQEKLETLSHSAAGSPRQSTVMSSTLAELRGQPADRAYGWSRR
jgi:polar amino acid transport system ATP-binding protein